MLGASLLARRMPHGSFDQHPLASRADEFLAVQRRVRVHPGNGQHRHMLGGQELADH